MNHDLDCIYCRRPMRECNCPRRTPRIGQVVRLSHATVIRKRHERFGVNRVELERLMREKPSQY